MDAGLFSLNLEKMLEEGKHADVVASVDNRLFEIFSSIADALGLPLQDGTEIPHIVTLLKERRFITERTSVRMLNALLTLDGVISQANQGEPLSRQDIVLLTGALDAFSKTGIILSRLRTCVL